jgi:signal transduction histidine kinase/ActR/RegA family two-component response regulator
MKRAMKRQVASFGLADGVLVGLVLLAAVLVALVQAAASQRVSRPAATLGAAVIVIALLIPAVRISRHDMARRIRAERMAREAQRLAAIVTAQNVIASDSQRERLVELVEEQARRLTGAAGAEVALVGLGGDLLAAGAAGADHCGAGVASREPAGEPVAGVLVGRGLVAGGEGLLPAELFHRLGARSLASVPLVCLGRRVGHLRVFSPAPVPFSNAAVADLGLLAGFAAAALSLSVELEAKESALHELRRAKEAADAANRTKSDFLAAMSHELRTPLNSIIGFSEILGDQRFGPLNPRQARYVDHVAVSGHHLLHLVNGVLDLAKVESGRMDLDLERIDLRDTLSEAVAVVQALAQAKRIAIEVSLPERPPPLLADAGKLKQVLFNLLSNAIKFTPQKGRLAIEVQSLDEAGAAMGGAHGVLLVSVSDSGIGIAPRDQERIFEAFEQIDSPLAHAYPGTGLGLALARKLVELHGGRIWAESNGSGKGSCFRFTLPLAAAGAGAGAGVPAGPRAVEAAAGLAPDEGRAAPPQRRAAPASAGAPLVLIVDADPHAREILRLCLHNVGYEIVEAVDGEGAMAVARRRQPQAIILDLLLPGRDGREVLAELRADAGTRDVPVIVVTVIEERALALRLGAQAFMNKPVDRELLVALVGEVTDPKAAAG